MKIGIVYDREKPEVKKLALEVKDWLKKRKHQVFLRTITTKNLFH